jgi:hypothetical protein
MPVSRGTGIPAGGIVVAPPWQNAWGVVPEAPGPANSATIHSFSACHPGADDPLPDRAPLFSGLLEHATSGPVPGPCAASQPVSPAHGGPISRPRWPAPDACSPCAIPGRPPRPAVPTWRYALTGPPVLGARSRRMSRGVPHAPSGVMPHCPAGQGCLTFWSTSPKAGGDESGSSAGVTGQSGSSREWPG